MRVNAITLVSFPNSTLLRQSWVCRSCADNKEQAEAILSPHWGDLRFRRTWTAFLRQHPSICSLCILLCVVHPLRSSCPAGGASGRTPISGALSGSRAPASVERARFTIMPRHSSLNSSTMAHKRVLPVGMLHLDPPSYKIRPKMSAIRHLDDYPRLQDAQYSCFVRCRGSDSSLGADLPTNCRLSRPRMCLAACRSPYSFQIDRSLLHRTK